MRDPDGYDATISAAVRALAAGRGLTHAECADAVDIARSTFERRLSQGRWSAAEVARLADYFTVTVDKLVTGLDGLVSTEDDR